jgi:hypothetical protein
LCFGCEQGVETAEEEEKREVDWQKMRFEHAVEEFEDVGPMDTISVRD